MANGAPTADLGAQLNAELTRIIKCPYPPSLSVSRVLVLPYCTINHMTRHFCILPCLID